MSDIHNSEDIAALIKKRREARELTQAGLAEAAGVGVRFIVDLEKGKPTCQVGKTLEVLQALEVSVSATTPEEKAAAEAAETPAGAAASPLAQRSVFSQISGFVKFRLLPAGKVGLTRVGAVLRPIGRKIGDGFQSEVAPRAKHLKKTLRKKLGK